MKTKLRSQKGFTLIEVLVSMLILVFMVIGMGPVMKTAVSVYKESTFQSNSTALMGSINATLADVLRYAEDVRVEDGDVVFSNTEYGLLNVSWVEGNETGTTGLAVRSSNNNSNNNSNNKTQLLLPMGAYPDMELSSFSIQYENGCFSANYTVKSTVDEALKREGSCSVMQINAG